MNLKTGIAGIVASAVISLGVVPAPFSHVAQACAFDFPPIGDKLPASSRSASASVLMISPPEF